MSTAPSTPLSVPHESDTRRTGTYVLVVVVEVATLAALWLLQQHYSL